MNKCTLLVDGNWLLMSRFAMNKEAFLKENSEFEKDMAVQECVNLMSKSISLVLTRFEGIIDNVVLVCDGQSWRKKVPKPAKLEADYKGTRVRDEDLDWNYVFKSLQVLEDNITRKGFTVSHIFNAEGDDAIWFWKSYLNEKKVNCVIWTSDNDLKQLVSYDDGVFTVWFNDRYGVFMDNKMNQQQDELEMFMMDSKNAAANFILESFSNQAETQVNYINPEDVVMEKIICGDKSDNIKAVVRIVKGGKTYSVTPKMWNEVKEKMNITDLDNFFANSDQIISELRKIKKFQETDLTFDDCLEQFDYNSKLVWLDNSTIPQEVQEEISYVPYFSNQDVDVLKMEETYVAEKQEVEELLPF